MGIVERLRERASAARSENTGTGLGDALHFEEAADLIERLREALGWALAEIEGRTRYRTSPAYTAAEQRQNALDCAHAALKEIEGD